MKKILFLLIAFFSIGLVQVDAQDPEKKVEKKVIVKKKTVKEDGTVVEEVIEAEGEEAEALLKKMKEEEGLEDIEIDIEMEGNMKKKKMKVHKEHKTIHKSHGKEKMIKVGVDTKKTGDGENVFVIKVDDGDGEKEFNWTGKEGEIPEEMKEFLQKDGMIIHLDEDGEGDMKEIIVKVESDEDLPKVNVRMGVELSDTGGPIEIGHIQDGSPAASSGLQSGDLITEIDGYHIGNYRGLMERLTTYKAGDNVEVRYIRDGKSSTVKLKLASKE